MIELTLNQILGIIVAVLALIPVPLLLKYYYDTKIFDFLIFGLFFLSGSVILIADPLASITNLLIAFQIHHMTIDFAFFLLFLHAIRIVWDKPPFLVKVIGVVWFIILIVLTLMWQIMIQPAFARVLIFDLPSSFSTYFPLGAGFALADGTIIYSTAFRYLGEFYRLFSLSLLLYAYITVELVQPTHRIIRAKKLWIAVWFLILIHSLSLFPWIPTNDFISFFLIVAGVIAAYITIRLPESVLLSQVQILRVYNLYKNLETYQDMNQISPLSMDHFVDYLKQTSDIHSQLPRKTFDRR